MPLSSSSSSSSYSSSSRRRFDEFPEYCLPSPAGFPSSSSSASNRSRCTRSVCGLSICLTLFGGACMLAAISQGFIDGASTSSEHHGHGIPQLLASISSSLSSSSSSLFSSSNPFKLFDSLPNSISTSSFSASSSSSSSPSPPPSSSSSSSSSWSSHSRVFRSLSVGNLVSIQAINRLFTAALGQLTASSLTAVDGTITGTTLTQSAVTVVGGAQRRLAGGVVDFTVHSSPTNQVTCSTTSPIASSASSSSSMLIASPSSSISESLGIGPDTLIDYRLVIASPSPLSQYTPAGALLSSTSVMFDIATPAGVEFPSLAPIDTNMDVNEIGPIAITLQVDGSAIAALGDSYYPLCVIFDFNSATWTNHGINAIGTQSLLITTGRLVSNGNSSSATLSCYPRVPGVISVVTNSSVAPFILSSNAVVAPSAPTVWDNPTYKILIWLSIAIGAFTILSLVTACVYKAGQLPEAKAGGLRAGLRAGARNMFRGRRDLFRNRAGSGASVNSSSSSGVASSLGRKRSLSSSNCPTSKLIASSAVTNSQLDPSSAVSLPNQATLNLSLGAAAKFGVRPSKDELILEADSKTESNFI